MRYRPTEPVTPALPGTLAAFLTDRRVLFAVDASGRVLSARVGHAAWPLQPAEAEFRLNTMAEAHGLRLPVDPPLLHFARRVDVRGWWPRREG